MEITRAYLAKQADELSLQQADVVLVLGGEDGECGEQGAAAELRWGEKLQRSPQTGTLAIIFQKLPGSC